MLANAGAAVDAQLGQVAVEANQSVTLTASSGKIPVTMVSEAPYAMVGTLELSSDKLLFPNGLTTYSKAETLLPHRSNVFYVLVRARASGAFRMDVTFRAPGSPLHVATGEVSVRSTSHVRGGPGPDRRSRGRPGGLVVTHLASATQGAPCPRRLTKRPAGRTTCPPR